MGSPAPFNEADVNKYIVAPYWCDIDTRSSGTVSYEVYSNGTNLPLLQRVSKFIQQKQQNKFTGTWMLAAEWNSVIGSGTSINVVTYTSSLVKDLQIYVGSKYGDLRLVQGTVSNPTFSAGRLEIFVNGEWGTICNDYFDLTDASVACKQLGYSGAIRFGSSGNEGYATIYIMQCACLNCIRHYRFNSGSGQIWLDDLHCTATDITLLSCRHREIGTHNCGHYEDIAVFCNSKL